MQLKNKFLLKLITTFMLLTVLTGCKNAEDAFITEKVNPQIDVFGVEIFMDESKVHDAIPTKGEKAMCIYGYEYEYEQSKVNIGFNSQTNKVRRVTTKNPDTSIYGIVPGMELSEAYSIVDSNGFTKSENSKYIFYKENIRLTLVSMKGTHADGVILEINPE
jgi:hypothetical protein